MFYFVSETREINVDRPITCFVYSRYKDLDKKIVLLIFILSCHIQSELLFRIIYFIPCPTRWGRAVLASPRMSVRPSSVCFFDFRAELYNPSMDFANYLHTHPLGGVDVPFGVFEILPTQLAGHN